ncbi:MAG: MarR family transcriptional regulator [Cyclobacteriaceae bacterium]|nr:MarR family transcriptional regulator [Cyclobacteriaceae bacterium]
MSIEEEIKQKSFQNEYHKLAVNLQFTSNWLSAVHAKVLRPFGISAQQFNVLRILKGQFPNPSSLILIRERMLDKESNASRLIDKLVSTGLTKRVQCSSNRRQVDITITKKGVDLLNQINPKVEELESTLSGLSVAEANQLNSLLDKLRDNR